jgi:nickel transport protein
MHGSLLKYLVGFSMFMAIFAALPAHAHKVNIFAYVEDGKICTESYFPDGKAVEGGTIEVLDSRNQKLAGGVTDKEGKWSTPVPKREDLTIVINASMGHKNSYLLKKSEIGE